MLQRKLIIAAAIAGLSTLGFSATSSAALPGYYVGGQLGWATTGAADADDLEFDDTEIHPLSGDVDDRGLAGRVFVGYQFNENWAAELGYTKFHNTKYDDIVAPPGVVIPSEDDEDDASIKASAVDLVAKGILPLGNCFNLYGKLGAAYLITSGGDDEFEEGKNKLEPTFGAGISYDITPNVPVDLSWNRIQRVGGNRDEHPIGSTDLFSLGIAYNFG